MNPDDPDYTSAVVWQGSQPELNLNDLVTLTAPVLWYSADEPLIMKGDIPLPHAHPCDVAADQGVVYYQVVKIHLRGSERVTIPAQDDPRFFEKVDDFTVRYYFYYHEDIGMNSHTHDLEVTELEIRLEQTEEGCYQVRVVRVSAFAHGTDWYTNELILEKDTRMPITLFVEEGKHAPCPDRNADGVYTPGYDVNVRINDAWGVRDVFGSGWLISPGYNAAMTKQRHPMFRMFPPESPYAAEEIHPFYSAFRDKGENAEHYVLRAANTVSMCENIPHGDFLLDMMTRHKFGTGNEPAQYASGSVRALAEPLEGVGGKLPTVNLRWDRDLGFSFAWGGWGIETYYLVPRITWIIENSQWSYEGMIMKSASRFMENYISVGAAYERDWTRDNNGNITVSSHNDWNFVTEVGVKFRFRLTGKLRVITLGNSFGGIRFGLRWSGFDALKNGRMIAEIGTGVW